MCNFYVPQNCKHILPYKWNFNKCFNQVFGNYRLFFNNKQNFYKSLTEYLLNFRQTGRKISV